MRRLRHDNEERTGLSLSPGRLNTGGNSGYQAVNLAVLLGAARIILLGYDMKPSATGALHCHPDHPDRNPHAAQLALWAGRFRSMLPDLGRMKVEVVNCSRETAIDCFPQAPLEAVL